jgi:hypothetical protein
MFVVCDVDSLIMLILSAKKSQKRRERDTIFGTVTHGHKPRIHAIPAASTHSHGRNNVQPRTISDPFLQRKAFQRGSLIVACRCPNGSLRQKKTRRFLNFRPGLGALQVETCPAPPTAPSNVGTARYSGLRYGGLQHSTARVQHSEYPTGSRGHGCRSYLNLSKIERIQKLKCRGEIESEID